MVITWYGQSCFKLQSGQSTLFFDPFDAKLGINPPKGEAQLILVTHDHWDHNNIKTIKGEPFIIDGPGEYEYRGIRARGIESFHDNKEGAERGLNTMYVVRMENITVAHLGDLGQKQLQEEQLSAMGAVDILLVPTGGTYTIDGAEALEIVNQIEPRIVIPMHYKVKGIKVKIDSVDIFLKELGAKDITPQDKLTIKAKDLPDPEEKMEVVVLKV